MPPPTTPFAEHVPPVARLEVLFEEIGELTGQRNAIDGRLVEIIAEIDGAGTHRRIAGPTTHHTTTRRTAV